ncbi:histone-lysine N-methyltransferase SETMAR [Erinaceus europaeus]|uniref:Histone-lysine N-methyltransferase SETMAR n=1 Tax=Erinaceus europaeus TaxID=9365 RepID=A0A1S3A6M4_ERIEU|nr:histone-lysine N-methyltransferase SETMAR [Erinaceus europaeus]
MSAGRQRRETEDSGEGPEAPAERLKFDIARGLENVPVSAWPPGAWPEPFQYSPDLVAGPGADSDPSQLSFPGCECLERPCLPGSCSCLRHGDNYDDNLCLLDLDSTGATCARPVFECHALCPCGEDCRNRLVQRGLQVQLQVFQTDAKGWGLRTLDPIPRGRFICEYAGELLGSAEAQRRSGLQGLRDPNYIQAVREHASGGQVLETFVDPARVGNVGRFLNHSCEPNLLMLPVRVHSMVPRLALFAARDILPGEELSYDYSGRFRNGPGAEEEERLEPGMPRKPCYCGTVSCTAFLPYDSSLYPSSLKPPIPDEGGRSIGESPPSPRPCDLWNM